MNIAKLMIPKVSTAFLHENDTVRQGLERFTIHGYTAIPVLNEREQYIGSVTEGDFLRHLLMTGSTDLKAQEQYRISGIVRRDFCPALPIDAASEEVVSATLNQNFVPIVDGRGTLCGILTRKRVIEYLAQNAVLSVRSEYMYNFDEIIDRRHTNAMNTDGFRQYIFHADENMVFPYKDEEFIRMWVADMEFATPDVVIDAIRRRLDRRIFGYTRVSDPGYYEAFSAWCRRRYGWDFPKEELVMSNGVIPALFELVEYICKPDEKVLFLTPSYAYFKHAADHSGRAYVCSDLINSDGYYSIDWEDLERRCAEPKTRLFIHCDPHNPSGRVWTPQELQRLAGILEKHDMWVISDEIHCDLLRRGQVHTPLGKVMPGYKSSSPAWRRARPSTSRG